MFTYIKFSFLASNTSPGSHRNRNLDFSSQPSYWKGASQLGKYLMGNVKVWTLFIQTEISMNEDVSGGNKGQEYIMSIFS